MKIIYLYVIKLLWNVSKNANAVGTSIDPIRPHYTVVKFVLKYIILT